ncbi:hypothetical protein GGI09_006760 [Coemansia sp. S100]|nr:hypothetical protein LPJ71_006923 [Coemansia sp. S17]KAJ2086064.1 hypothetical protein GGI09_006760 [Coemansia sp. S100]
MRSSSFSGNIWALATLALMHVASGSLCHSAYWGSKLQDKYLMEVTMTSSMSHRHMVYETSLPKPYRIVHQEEDGDDAEDADDMSWVNRGHEERAKRMIRLKLTVDDRHQIQQVECG